MDRVRLGRVLGKGARLAARTALEAVDAATATAPDSKSAGPRQAVPPTVILPGPPQTARQGSMQGNSRVSAVSLPLGLLPAARAARAGVISPLKRASRALWHELTGSFFALFAFSFAVGAWRTRAGLWSSVSRERNRSAAFCALALLFLYFSVSSFLRARRRA